MNNYSLDREALIKYLKELAILLKKNHSQRCELVLVGGSSILLNYTYRDSTTDIDCYDVQGILMNDLVNKITTKYDLPVGWINTDFINTDSYTEKIAYYSSYYATYSNVLEIRTVKGQYLIAMKMKSAREYKHDLSDICGIINEMNKNNEHITMDDIKKAIVDLYGSLDAVSGDMYDLVESVLSDPTIYEKMIEFENSHRINIKQDNK